MASRSLNTFDVVVQHLDILHRAIIDDLASMILHPFPALGWNVYDVTNVVKKVLICSNVDSTPKNEPATPPAVNTDVEREVTTACPSGGLPTVSNYSCLVCWRLSDRSCIFPMNTTGVIPTPSNCVKRLVAYSLAVEVPVPPRRKLRPEMAAWTNHPPRQNQLKQSSFQNEQTFPNHLQNFRQRLGRNPHDMM